MDTMTLARWRHRFSEWCRSTAYMRTTTRPMDVGEQMAQRDAYDLLTEAAEALAALPTQEQANEPTLLSESVACGTALSMAVVVQPSCEHCGKPLACPGEQAERIAGLELTIEETLDRAEQAERERDAFKAALPTRERVETIVDAVMDGLGGRSGILDGVDFDIRAEIRADLVVIVANFLSRHTEG